eukprot:TRINITY_DN8541_c0_g2_i1.p1 TRINITY_DN8541_c0_g2~~TRINITY_DN8541_c0_g2_i1.p1  ORF type:complete len:232 (+),score=59.16 TRINITY_DN8541_c0_g2_i1:224-919(+)
MAAKNDTGMVLYIYDHCPYCVRAEMIFGLKNVPVTIEVFLNDDEEGPKSKIGAKQAPILKKPDGSYMPESMDIVAYVDTSFGGDPVVLPAKAAPELDAWLKDVRMVNYKLTMPRWVAERSGLPEFATQSAREYFINKKTATIGDFATALADTPKLIEEMNTFLEQLEKILPGDGASYFDAQATISANDFFLFPLLRGLTIVKDLKFPAKVSSYVDFIAERTKVSLYHDKAY